MVHLIARLGPMDGSELLLFSDIPQGVLALSELDLSE